MAEISETEKQAHEDAIIFLAWQEYAAKIMGKCPHCQRLPEWLSGPDIEDITRVGHSGEGKTRYHWWGKENVELKGCDRYSKLEDFTIVT